MASPDLLARGRAAHLAPAGGGVLGHAKMMIKKRQWHTNVWSVDNGEEVTTSAAAAAGKSTTTQIRTVVVTNIVGTTTVGRSTSTAASSSPSSIASIRTTPTTAASSTSPPAVITPPASSTFFSTPTGNNNLITITTLPSGADTASTAAATSSSGVVDLQNAAAASGKGMSTGGIMGVVVGVLLGLAAFLIGGGWLYRKYKQSKSTSPHRDPFARRSYRDSSLPINDKTTPYPFAYRDNDSPPPTAGRPHSGYALSAMSEKFEEHQRVFAGTPPVGGENMAGRGAVNLVPGQQWPYAVRTPQHGHQLYQPQMQQAQQQHIPMPVPTIVVPSSGKVRELTGGGVYGGSGKGYKVFSDSPGSSDEGHAGGAELGRVRSESPTDPYGQAGVHARGYGGDEEGPFGDRYSSVGSRASMSNNNNNNNGGGGTMLQLPPLSPGVFETPLSTGFGSFNSLSAQQQQQQQRNSQKHADLARELGLERSESEKMRQGFRDLARSAEVAEPVTPVDALYADNGAARGAGNARSGMGMLMPPMVPTPYQHGRPLSPLDEVDTPMSTPQQPSTGHSLSPFIPRTPSRASPSGLPYTPNPGPQSRNLTGSDISSLPPHSGVPPSINNPPPTPGVALPESPSAFSDSSPPQSMLPQARGPFRGMPKGSAVSLDAAYPETPNAYRFSGGTFNSPGSTRTLGSDKGEGRVYGYGVQQGPSAGVGLEDAYGGI